jgi:hypothetical protein
MRMISRLVTFLELLGGARSLGNLSNSRRIALGLWWALLFLVICVSIGRATKFIYVDF